MRSLLMIALFMFSLTACGKKGVLYYPDMLVPVAPASTSVSQSGSAIKLQFLLPDNDRTGRRLLDLAGVKINKRGSDSPQEQLCNSCMTEYRLFRKLYLDLLPNGVQRYGNRIFVLDDDVSDGKTYSYSVVPFTKDGVDGLASPQISVRLVQPVLGPVIQAESFPTEIRISFVSMASAIGTFVGYNIYRTTQQDKVAYLPINKEPLMVNDFVDSGLKRNMKYHYTVRTVVKLETGNEVESLASNVVDGMLKNDE
ncbi:MAG: hypothetical protein WCP20_05115 [Desulfuromonadales bacterium]